MTLEISNADDLEITDAGKTAEVEPTADYGASVELGTRFMSARRFQDRLLMSRRKNSSER